MATSLPWEGDSTGDAGSYSDDQWQKAWRALAGGYGHDDAIVVPYSGANGVISLDIQPTSPATRAIRVRPGIAFARGIMVEVTGDETVSLPTNNSGVNRIDSIIVRINVNNQTGRIVRKAGSSSPPSLTRTGGIYEYPLADVTLSDGYTSVTESNITPRGMPLLGFGSTSLYLQNNTGSDIEPFRAVKIDSSNNQSMELADSTREIIGTVTGRVSNGDWGHVIHHGVSFIYVGSSVTRGNGIILSSTNGVFDDSSGGRSGAAGLFLESQSSAGYALGHLSYIPGDTASEAMERDISWSGINSNDAILTNLTPPSATKMIYIAFRQESQQSWEGGLFIDYDVWDGFTTVASGVDITSSNSWSYYAKESDGDRDIAFRVSKGTGGVLAVASSGIGNNPPGDNSRFDKICVRWVT